MGTFMKALVDDLMHHKGSALISVGTLQPAEVHARAHRLNVLLGASGKTVHYLPAAASAAAPEDVRAAVGNLKAGAFKALYVLDCNPAYMMPGAMGFADAVSAFRAAGGKLVHLGLYRDETSKLADWHLPVAHAFEAWSDAIAWDGTHSIGQPTLTPLYGGRTVAELLSWMVKSPKTPREMVRAGLAVDDKAWRRALHDGVVADSAIAVMDVSAKALPAFAAGDLTVAPANGSMEVRFMRDRRIGDGRQANMGWLQELPDPMTKLTWDNAALMSFATAESLGVKHESMVKLELDGRSIEMPVYLMPGHADGSVSLQLGFGRTDAGHVAGLNDDAIEPVGHNVNPLRGGAMLATGLTVTALGGNYKLAVTQDHFAIDDVGMQARAERLPQLVKEGTVADYEEQPRFAKSAADFWGKDSNLWKELDPETDPLLEKPKHKWGMAIDLSTCTGCSACTIACQSENNIPVVGKDQVLKGREMHWIRMDRYFLGSTENPTAMSQPIACQHCEMAPCESVCPVAATTHSSEGLNDMVYNRCIGTRYCSNNCPYKVRRFNYFDYNKDADMPGNEVLRMSANPEVTVRSRGVMEKCSMCVQRIEKARISNRNPERDTHIPDGSFEVACQQACPSGSIVFGDLMDEHSAVRQAHLNPRSYALLAELNNKPRNVFLARIRNPHPALEVAGEEVVSHG
jgi:molybdopterin-containing oxidoreductase family iron-sulfur binding subunit